MQKAPIGGENDSGEDEIDICNVKTGHIVDHGSPKATVEGRSNLRKSFVECRFNRSSRLEGLCLASEPSRQNEGADDADRNIRAHPNLASVASLARRVSGRKVKNQFAKSVADQSSKARSDQPSKLAHIGVGDKRFVPNKNDWHGEERQYQEDVEDAEEGVHEAAHPLINSHLADVLAPETEVELDGGVDCADCPSCSLFEVGAEILGNGTKLESFVDESRMPTLTKHKRRRCNIFGERPLGKVADRLESVTSSNIARACTPCYSHDIFDGLRHVNEEVQALAEWITFGNIVEQLGRASETHLWIHEHMRHDCTEPVLLWDHICI